MTLYIIIALSFAIMYSYKYTHEIVCVTAQFVEDLEVDWGSFNPTWYYIKEFTYNFIMFPIAIQKLFKKDIIMDEVSYILENNYGLESEK